MHRNAWATQSSTPGPLMPGKRPGHRIWACHSRKPPARRAALSGRVIHASAVSCADRGAKTWNSACPS
eukprot:1708254-Lingulodinium_polyedra.AAC.1